MEDNECTSHEPSLNPCLNELGGVDEPTPFSMTELKGVLKTLKTGKACGEDGIPAEFLKKLGPKGRLALLKTLNTCLHTTIPKDWNVTRVQLIFKGKGEDKQDINSYRPIAIGSCVYKVFAGLMKQRLQSELESHGNLSDLQNGFRPNHSISDNLFVLLQLIEIAHRKRKPLYLCFLDIMGAFDNVDRASLAPACQM